MADACSSKPPRLDETCGRRVWRLNRVVPPKRRGLDRLDMADKECSGRAKRRRADHLEKSRVSRGSPLPLSGVESACTCGFGTALRSANVMLRRSCTGEAM